MPRYFLTEEAAEDLRAIWDYIAPENKSAADRVIADLVSGFEHLALWPRTGRPRPEITQEAIRFWLVRKWLIAYVENQDAVIILAVFHGAQDLPAVIGERIKHQSSDD